MHVRPLLLPALALAGLTACASAPNAPAPHARVLSAEQRALADAVQSALRAPRSYRANANYLELIANQSWRVEGSVRIERAADGALAARIEASVRAPDQSEAHALSLWLREPGEQLCVDRTARSYTTAAQVEQLPKLARVAAALWPGHARSDEGLAPSGGPRRGPPIELAGRACRETSAERRAADGRREQGRWTLDTAEGALRACELRLELPGTDTFVERWTELAGAAPDEAQLSRELAPPTDFTRIEAEPLARFEPPPIPAVSSLANSLGPLRAAFEADAGHPRVLVLLAPTCLNCLRLARSVRRALLEAVPAPQLRVYIAWVDVLDGDNEATTREAAQFVPDARVRHFHDSERRLGRAFAPVVGMPAVRDLLAAWGSSVDEQDQSFLRDFVVGPATAYDWVLFFGPEARWGAELPQPVALATAMAPDTWQGIDPARFAWGSAMEQRLRELAQPLLSKP